MISGPREWAMEQFGQVDLGDKRLNQRAVKVAGAMAADPQASIPQQNKTWKATKGAYRLFDHQKATFESLSQPCWQETNRLCQMHDVVLILQDTTWLSYKSHPATVGLGWHGPSRKGGWIDCGLLLHGALAVAPLSNGSAQVLGLAWNKLWARKGKPVGMDQPRRSQRRRSDQRESLRWSQAVKAIGSAPDHHLYLHVGDRESDLFDLYQTTAALAQVGFVVRISKDRNASLGHDTPDTLSREKRVGSSLFALCRSLQKLGTKQMWIGSAAKSGRTAKLSVAGGAITLWSPQLKCTGRALRCWAVRVWEEDPPEGQQPIEWMLLTSQPVFCLGDALRITGYYTLRWLIEEYHQCLKSGCKVEERQLENADRLEPLIAILCAVAVRLLQLKNNARHTPDQPASLCVPAPLVATLARMTRIDANTMTVRQFVHETAKLGGFLARKQDGEPGWKTLWRGWHDLSLIHQGYQMAKTRPRCG